MYNMSLWIKMSNAYTVVGYNRIFTTACIICAQRNKQNHKDPELKLNV